MKTKCKLMANRSFDINKTNNHTKNPTNNISVYAITFTVKSKKKKYLGSGKPNWLVSVVSNFAKVAYAWAKSSLLLICKTSLKITKRNSEFIYRGRRENQLTRRQRTITVYANRHLNQPFQYLTGFPPPYNDGLSV
jgi:hypothetical protein